LKINALLKAVGMSDLFVSASNDWVVAVIDCQTGKTINEVPATMGIGSLLSKNADLLAGAGSRGQVVVWDVRRSPERWACASGLVAAIGVLLFACWRSWRNRIPASG